jgi:hypothetical protein
MTVINKIHAHNQRCLYQKAAEALWLLFFFVVDVALIFAFVIFMRRGFTTSCKADAYSTARTFRV